MTGNTETYTIPALTITKAQHDKVVALTGAPIEYAFMRPAPFGDAEELIVQHSDEYVQHEWVISQDGTHTAEWRYLDVDGWNTGNFGDNEQED